jgi:hypothetical protein
MQDAYDAVRLGTLIDEIQDQAYDIPQFQRMFARNALWVSRLMGRLWSGGGRIGSLLVWTPRDDLSVRSRYHRRLSPGDTLWIIDGQQRITAILAAFGITPPWMSPQQWQRCGGPGFEMGITMDRTRHP